MTSSFAVCGGLPKLLRHPELACSLDCDFISPMTCAAWADWGAAIIDLIVAMVLEDCASAAHNGTATSWGSGMSSFPLDTFELLLPLFSPGLLSFSLMMSFQMKITGQRPSSPGRLRKKKKIHLCKCNWSSGVWRLALFLKCDNLYIYPWAPQNFGGIWWNCPYNLVEFGEKPQISWQLSLLRNSIIT